MTTFSEEDGGGGDEVVPELSLKIGEDGVNGGYVKLGSGPCDCEVVEGLGGVREEPLSPRNRAGGCLWNFVKLVLLGAFLGLLAAVCIKWVGPFFMDKVGFRCEFGRIFCGCGCACVCVLELVLGVLRDGPLLN
jgi:hypothetical protein